MPFSDKYRSQAALLLRVLPLVAEEKDFALKGGTAINLFIRDMPRLSVDIDLLANEGIDDPLRRAFVVYIISHSRPCRKSLHRHASIFRENMRAAFRA